MAERGCWLSALGVAAIVLLTGCNDRPATEYPVCPKNSKGVADQIGGDPKEWRILRGSELWEYRGPVRTFTGQRVGKILVGSSDGVPKVLSPGQEATADEVIFRCNSYDKLNPQQNRALPKK